MTRPSLRIIKVGGSLLECERLPQMLTEWLTKTGDNQSDRREAAARIDVFVAGGGILVDQVRELDSRFALEAETAHWMSVCVMSSTSELLARLMKVGQLVRRWDDLGSKVVGGGPQRFVFDVRQWLGEIEAGQPGVRLTLDWRTTSDSIAARLAHVVSADELVLLKSTDINVGVDWRTAAEQGLVDEHFPQVVASDSPRISWVNLRQFDRCGAPLPSADAP